MHSHGSQIKIQKLLKDYTVKILPSILVPQTHKFPSWGETNVISLRTLPEKVYVFTKLRI